MLPEPRKLYSDMLDAVNAITEFVGGKTLSSMRESNILRSAIYFQFMIIGEALTQLRDLDDDLLDPITESHRIIGFRNQIVHGYSKIDDEITWRIIEQKLPILRQDLSNLLGLSP